MVMVLIMVADEEGQEYDGKGGKGDEWSVQEDTAPQHDEPDEPSVEEEGPSSGKLHHATPIARRLQFMFWMLTCYLLYSHVVV